MIRMALSKVLVIIIIYVNAFILCPGKLLQFAYKVYSTFIHKPFFLLYVDFYLQVVV